MRYMALSVVSLALVAAAFTALPVSAQELPDRDAALEQVFAADAPLETVVFPHPSLNAAQVDLLTNAVAQGLMPEMVFYGSLAIAPDQGLADPTTTVAVGNFHSPQAADAAALARCDAAREEGADCVVVMQIRPAGWSEGAPLQLSAGAAEALEEEFRRGVFSISPTSGSFGSGATADEANTACNADDCRPVVAN